MKVRKIRETPIPTFIDPRNELWQYEINWQGEQIVSKPHNIDIEKLLAQDMWRRFCIDIGIEEIRRKIYLLYRTTMANIKDHETAKDIKEQFNHLFDLLDKLEDVGDNHE